LRILVTPGSICPGFRIAGGDGIPHRRLTSSRVPSGTFLTTGASLSGKMERYCGRLPTRSSNAPMRSRIAS
jgi:hypothetical protein